MESFFWQSLCGQGERGLTSLKAGIVWKGEGFPPSLSFWREVLFWEEKPREREGPEDTPLPERKRIFSKRRKGNREGSLTCS